MQGTSDVVGRLEVTGQATREELAWLLRSDESEAALFAAADRVRRERVGDEVHLRALIEFSNHCWRNCRYCGLRREHREVTRYRMSFEEMLAAVETAAELGYGTVVLQSGEDPYYAADLLATLLRVIKAQYEVAATLSIGERSEEDYRRLRDAGADRFLLRMETSSSELYRALHVELGQEVGRPRRKAIPVLSSARQWEPTWESRRECLRVLRGLDYQVGSGVMIGLPGQTAEMLADDLLFLQSLDLDMVGVGPFIPHPATPLAEAAGGTLPRSLRAVACLRLLCPETLIPATTALGALHPEGRQRALQVGANVLMPNCTPPEYREHYQLYPGKICLTETGSECRGCIEGMVAGLGRRVAAGPGHSLRSQRAAVGV